MIKSVDTETTGTDLYHGNLPYLVTFCDDNGNNKYWEWDVDPETRQPLYNSDDLDDIEDELSTGTLVLQNPVFDVEALTAVDPVFGRNWRWEDTEDTLLASHILSTNTPHNLDWLADQYLGIDLSTIENGIRDATNHARSIVKMDKPTWKIAKPGMPDMPSVKSQSSKVVRGKEQESYWKADMWLPRSFVVFSPEDLPGELGWKQGDNPEEHSWATVCATYANSDTGVTLPLWHELKLHLEKRGLYQLYVERQKLLRIVHLMQRQGITINLDRLRELKKDYNTELKRANRALTKIANNHGYELDLPKGANNDSLAHFCFGYEPKFNGDGITTCSMCSKNIPKTERGKESWFLLEGKWYCKKCECKRFPGSWLNLPVLRRSAKTNKPQMTKDIIDELALQLDGEQKTFVVNLRAKRKLGKSLEYITSYLRYMTDNRDPWARLHSSLNPCGTDTLRWSSHNPSQQVISKQKDHNGRNLRYIFGPGDGRVWYSSDYDNLELRLPAYECQEPAMLELFESPDVGPYFGSYHLLIFSILHPDKYDHDDPEGLIKARDKYKATWYQWTKNGNFADMYGAVDTGDGKGTADRAYHVPGAQAIISKKLVKKSELNRYWINFARKHGYVETMPDRKVNPDKGYPVRCRRNEMTGQVVDTVPLNYHIQSTACWVVMRAMIEVQKLLDHWNRLDPDAEYAMVMNIHDELVFDFPIRIKKGKDLNLPKVRAIRRKMESIGKDINVPLTCGLDRHDNNWSEGVSL